MSELENTKDKVFEIKRWMKLHLKEHIDSCNEVNCTSLVEAWDRAQSTGDSTMNPEHPAWEIASSLAREAKSLASASFRLR